MIWIIQSIFLGVSLAMDACCVSMSNGLFEPKMTKRKMIFIVLVFGIFQGVMPLIGYLFGSLFEKWIDNLVPIIGFLILAFIGGKMIYESFHNDEEEAKSLSIKTIIIQAIATSIDALTVGIIYVGSSYLEAYVTFALVAVITSLLCVVAVMIGKKFGTKFSNKATIFGGLILIGIGLKLLIEYIISFF